MFAAPARADSVRDQQWFLSSLHVLDANRVSKGEGITVALIDTGVSASHPDLVGNVLPGAVTYVGTGRSGDAWHDPNGHGTGMAGNIAAHGHGLDAGALGIASAAKILPIADAGDGGRTNDAAMTASIKYAIERRVQVICLAEGGGGGTPDLATAVRAAEDANIVVVAAVGNRSQGSLVVDAPADLPGVLSVGSVDQNGNHAADSVTGSAVVLSAPGVDIVHPAPGGGYSAGTGTSDATSITAGAVALVRAKYPNLSAAEVIHRLTATATDKGPPGRDDEYGYGVINIVAALTVNVPPLSASASPAPSASDQKPGSGSPRAQQQGTKTSLLAIVIPVGAVLVVLLGFLGWRAARRRTP
ncbi:S8 family serine peptidase [Rugosimonospora acidiphila]